MILCFRCRRLSPAGSLHCIACGTALGGRYCEGKHLNPLYAQHCRICGSMSLSEGTMALPLRPLTYLLSCGLLVLCIRWGVAHYQEVLRTFWQLARFGVASIFFNGQVSSLDCLLCHVAKILFTAWLLGWLLWLFSPEKKGGRVGEALRGLPFSILRYAWPLLYRLLVLLGRGTLRLFFAQRDTMRGDTTAGGKTNASY